MEDNSYARTGRKMFIIAWLILFGLLFAFFYVYDQHDPARYEIDRGTLTIKSDRQGHYRVKGFINNKAVEFMVDTGASLVAIPKTVADELHLQGRYPITLNTASGEVTGLLTRLDRLSFGPFELKNIKAVILPDEQDEMVLLGMNVLSLFNLSQKDRQLIIEK
ncbi:TIGR02281 family clan AA aspartic protease [Legionella taurinensis]|uniref:TIGR02281 family clan AA aspartic protease n=1 Tax=Legionella taurinensis TaxID=70611 RepID=A0A3A5L7E2_9GAMM|nr:TIGR02281 family clan AA aspartic protease [Legionella taurinensis]MDX1836421.1 TIGR02281 family clan AA aspartic protease [Legionella taurinensis]PUT43107.1 TIGR02281 family clan AA aspartic protease [Legionella taurinensis]PUT45076.1 TIGR02281 family clan AA aspartic protease [Legionella taurinensis]PUT45662.1 TIGR02281 family clan AA aspartic protease [Legionella taurinensis]PUT49431.1 TIGR02281 family clan AA aspartic protease [Legionella taurinensis]